MYECRCNPKPAWGHSTACEQYNTKKLQKELQAERKIIFVILPYKHESLEVMEERVALAEKYCAKLMMQGHYPICTTSFGHHLIKSNDIPASQAFWELYCREMVRISKEIHLLKLEGWDKSVGVADEIKLIKMTQKHLIEIEPEDI